MFDWTRLINTKKCKHTKYHWQCRKPSWHKTYKNTISLTRCLPFQISCFSIVCTVHLRIRLFNASKNTNSTLCNNFSWGSIRTNFLFPSNSWVYNINIRWCETRDLTKLYTRLWFQKVFFFSQCRERILINMLKWNLIGSTTKFSRVGVPKTYAYNSTLSIIAIRVLVFLTFWFVWYCISVLPL